MLASVLTCHYIRHGLSCELAGFDGWLLGFGAGMAVIGAVFAYGTFFFRGRK